MANSKSTSKYHIILPKKARKPLKLKVAKATSFDPEFAHALNSTLSEWDSAEDDECFNDLQAMSK